MDRNYDLTEVGGEIYLLDRNSGSVYVKQAGEFVPIFAADPPDSEQLSQVREFGPVSLPPKPDGSVTIDGRYKYLNGMLRYSLAVTVSRTENSALEEEEESAPTSGDAEDFLTETYDSIALSFLDGDGFEVATAKINLRRDWENTARIAGEEGAATSYSIDGKVPLDAADYLIISTESISVREAKPVSGQQQAGEGTP